MSEEFWKVRVTKDHLVFSAAHFITFNGNICERLHGHNWRVAAEIEGSLDENYYVFDFIALRDGLQTIVDELDHRVLLPTKHQSIAIEQEGAEIEARFENRRWVFPDEDCILLPVENTTAELIARWMAYRFLDSLTPKQKSAINYMTLEVEENFGQWGSVRVEVD